MQIQLDELSKLHQGTDPLTVSPEVFQQIGSITRVLHDTMQQLGVMPKLQIATDGLPDARSRL
ncbi:MAG: protein phosphatase CheZ, partial [Burkholderiaceae bacterium]|nr:protein phosphatase CheZ [Burkholderiaceae bacterium]